MAILERVAVAEAPQAKWGGRGSPLGRRGLMIVAVLQQIVACAAAGIVALAVHEL